MIDFVCKSRYTVEDFRQLIHVLRQKDGCPWDSVQTHASIRDNFLEETYEACEAIDNGDTDLLKEELGDVLMQVLFHASIEEDAGRFDLDDVADAACKKLVFRHPGLFAASGVNSSWDELKRQEKGYATQTQSLDAVARSLPALWRARKIQKRAAQVGFDWPDLAASLAKVEEETGEVLAAAQGHGDLEEELGDALFALADAARHAGIDPEKALHRASDKFIARFAHMERHAPKPLPDLTAEEYLALWVDAKKHPGT